MPSKFNGNLTEVQPSQERSKYVWNEADAKGTSLREFLDAHPPSKTKRQPNSDGWIWVRSKRSPGVLQDVDKDAQLDAITSAEEALKDLVARFDEIEANKNIPKTKTKTSGPSKRMVREAASAETAKQLRELGESLPSGKWLFFEGPNYVDLVFNKLAQSIIDGPLSKLENANCHTVKVATADSRSNGSRNRDGDSQQLVCLYFDDIWNRDHAIEVLECIVKEHGQIPNSAKPDLYTYIDLTSNHPTKIRSTLYRPSELINYEVMREWQTERREREREKREHEAGSSDKGKGKTSAIHNGLPEPIDPTKFWPDPDEKAGHDLEVNVTAKSPASSTSKSPAGTVEKVKDLAAQRHTDATPSKPDKAVADDEDGSETESEDEDGNKVHFVHYMSSNGAKSGHAGASVQTPEKRDSTNERDKSSVSNSSPQRSPSLQPPLKKNKLNTGDASSSTSASPQPASSIASDKGKTPAKDEIIKSTPLIKFSRQQLRKRDRYGRDDF